MRHETLSEDPDLEQAIDDLAPLALELRKRSAAMLALGERDPQRRMHLDNIRDLYARIALRADRIGTTGDALVEILNAVLDSKARRGRPAPAGDTSRTLLTALSNATAREEAAHRALTAAQIEVREATRFRTAAEEACRAFGVPRIAR